MTSAERARVASMCAGLVVLALLILRARDPEMWKWLVPDDSPAAASSNLVAAPAAVSVAERQDVTDSAMTDEDGEQRTAAVEEFQAITDGTLETQPEEMPAYWRLMSWVHNQSLVQMKRRAQQNVVFADMVHRPNAHRGGLLQLDLHVRRILSYDVPSNPLGIERLYELWGSTNESRAWLYVAVVPELPQGTPVGPDIDERMTLCGYFFKLQGYREAGAAPRDKPLLAPLLLGRAEWHWEVDSLPRSTSVPWSWWVFALAALLVGGRACWSLLRPKRPPTDAAPGAASRLGYQEWMDGICSQEASDPTNERSCDETASDRQR
jgi:hypothetical protein